MVLYLVDLNANLCKQKQTSRIGMNSMDNRGVFSPDIVSIIDWEKKAYCTKYVMQIKASTGNLLKLLMNPFQRDLKKPSFLGVFSASSLISSMLGVFTVSCRQVRSGGFFLP